MRLYRQYPAQPLKWLLALIVFVFALTYCFEDVHGMGGNDYDNMSVTDNAIGEPPSENITDPGAENNESSQAPAAPTAVPEPTTMLLVASGLGAMYVARRTRTGK